MSLIATWTSAGGYNREVSRLRQVTDPNLIPNLNPKQYNLSEQ